MHNLGNHASLPHRETGKKAVWRHNQLLEVSLVYSTLPGAFPTCIVIAVKQCYVSPQQPLPNGAPMGAMKCEIIK